MIYLHFFSDDKLAEMTIIIRGVHPGLPRLLCKIFKLFDFTKNIFNYPDSIQNHFSNIHVIRQRLSL